MTLGGWQRLWVLVSGLYLIVVIVVAWREFPQRSNIRHDSTIAAAMRTQYSQLVRARPGDRAWSLAQRVAVESSAESAESRATETQGPVRIARGWGITLPNRHTLYFAENTPEDVMWQTANDYLAVVDARLTLLRRRFLFMSVAAWLVGCLALYAAGSSIGWVVRGFRRTGE